MFEQDYLLRQIKEFIAFMMKLLFDAELHSADALTEYQQHSGGDDTLFRMIDSGQILEADVMMHNELADRANRAHG